MSLEGPMLSMFSKSGFLPVPSSFENPSPKAFVLFAEYPTQGLLNSQATLPDYYDKTNKVLPIKGGGEL